MAWIKEEKTPFKCPACDGTGKVSRPPHIAGDQETWSDSSCGPYQCNACNGSGIVWDIKLIPMTNREDINGNSISVEVFEELVELGRIERTDYDY